jgi:hypothetical protein
MESTILARRLGLILIAWGIASAVIGGVLLLVPNSLLQGIGLQALLWGIIDLIIALVGVFRSKEQPVEKITRFLRINVCLDVIYQIVGLVLIVVFWANAFLVGNGIGVIIQGAFLFGLDLYFYRKFQAFTEEVHG